MPRARARRSDPIESHDAASSVGQLTQRQQAVKEALRMLVAMLGRPVLDEELVEHYDHAPDSLRWPKQTASGIRSRRAELGAAGLLEQGPRRRMSTGREGRTWRLR